jgi:hypothetical protein
MSIKFRSTRLLEELKRRRQAFATPIQARISVPSDLHWWYFLEFGTALKGGRGSAYPILPINASILKFPIDGRIVFAKSVMHPGVRPTHMIAKVLQPIGEMAARELADAIVNSGFNPEAARSRLLEVVMPQVKKLIVESIAIEVPGTRADGRLQGKSASQDFDDRAFIQQIN